MENSRQYVRCKNCKRICINISKEVRKENHWDKIVRDTYHDNVFCWFISYCENVDDTFQPLLEILNFL